MGWDGGLGVRARRFSAGGRLGVVAGAVAPTGKRVSGPLGIVAGLGALRRTGDKRGSRPVGDGSLVAGPALGRDAIRVRRPAGCRAPGPVGRPYPYMSRVRQALEERELSSTA